MRKLLFSLTLISFFCFNIYAIQDKDEKADVRDYIISAGEVFFIDLSAITADYALNDNPWTFLKPSVLKYNLGNPWIWDNSPFLRNQIAHPLIGSFYFNAARSNSISFLPSVLYSLAGSAMWETIFQLGEHSINDIITTTFTGTITGEIIYRLSCELYQVCPALGLFMNPVGAINAFFRNQPLFSEGEIYSSEIYLGSGISNYNLSFPNSSFEGLSSLRIPLLTSGFEIIYENPYGHSSKAFMDQFTVAGQFNFDNENKYFNLNLDSILYGSRIYLTEKAASTVGATFNYDFTYSSDFFHSINTLGVSLKQYFPLNNHWNFYWDGQLNFIYFGVTDTYYLFKNDPKETFISGVSDYTYNLGGELFLFGKIENDKFGCFKTNLKADVLFPYIECNGDKKKDATTIIASLQADYSHSIYKNLSIGINDTLINKTSIFPEAQNYNHLINYASLYLKYSFN